MSRVSLSSLRIANFSGFSVSSMVVPPPFLSPMTCQKRQRAGFYIEDGYDIKYVRRGVLVVTLLEM